MSNNSVVEIKGVNSTQSKTLSEIEGLIVYDLSIMPSPSWKNAFESALALAVKGKRTTSSIQIEGNMLKVISRHDEAKSCLEMIKTIIKEVNEKHDPWQKLLGEIDTSLKTPDSGLATSS